jgi:hypothetical protein
MKGVIIEGYSEKIPCKCGSHWVILGHNICRECYWKLKDEQKLSEEKEKSA